ncbi:MAG: hypothetical protein A4S08_00445 [Proteobacteria bacterium SG_bin4]|nr:MAG: hypothetical protein A4S08_00445 [Proteobacteria bacterium SG_bin4]
MKFMQKISRQLFALVILLNTSASLYAFNPPEGYQGRFSVPRTLLLQPGITNPDISPSIGNPGSFSEFVNNITQQEGLRICFYELEVDVRNCSYAFQNNVPGYNECVTMAGEAHTSCLTWVQKLPVEENQN